MVISILHSGRVLEMFFLGGQLSPGESPVAVPVPIPVPVIVLVHSKKMHFYG